MAMSRGQQVVMWKETLALCGLGAEESVIVLSGERSRPENLEAATTAVQEIGARLARLHVYDGAGRLADNDPAMEALRRVDMLIDLVGIHLMRGGEQEAIMKAGARILYVTEPPEVLARMRPSPDDKARVCAAARAIEKTRRMHVASAAGTDLTVELGEYPILREYGYADEPGHWDHWPAGFVATWPNERSATGTVVLDRGDIIFPFNTYVNTPIRLTIEDGYIDDIEGAFDAEYLSEYFRQYGDPEAYAVSHLGWGAAAQGALDRAGHHEGPDQRQRRALVPRQLHVLDRAEHRCRRRARHAVPSRHADAQLLGLARRNADADRGRSYPRGSARSRIRAGILNTGARPGRRPR